MANDNYENLPQSLKLRVNAHIVNAFGQSADFLNQFRHMSNSASSDGRDGAQKTLDMLRDALAPQAENLARVSATNIPADLGQIRDLQRQLIQVIGEGIDYTKRTGAAAITSPEYIAGVVNDGLQRISKNGDARTNGSNLSLSANQLTLVMDKMENLSAALNVAAQCTAQLSDNSACVSLPKIASPIQR